MKELINFRNVKKTYTVGEKSFDALNGASFTINKGELVVILGPSGAGKSTILNLLGGMDKATSGEIIIDGKDISKLSNKELTKYRAENIGFIFQFYNILPTLTVQENVEIPLMDAKLSQKEKHKRALLFIEAVGLLDKKKQTPKSAIKTVG